MEFILELLKPVQDEKLTELHERNFKGSRLAILTTVLLLPLTIVLAGFFGQDHVELAIGITLGLEVISLAMLFVLEKTSWGRRGPSWMILLNDLVVAAYLWLCSTYIISNFVDIRPLLFMLPIIAVAFVPMRFTQCVTMGVGLFLLNAWFEPLNPHLTPMSLIFKIFLSCVGMGFAVLASQIQRNMYARLHDMRHQLIAVDRLGELGRNMAGIAHELKTPTAAALNSLQESSSLVNELHESIGHPQVTEDDLREIATELSTTLNAARSSTERSARFLGAVHEHTRHLHERRTITFDIKSQLDKVLMLLQHRIRSSAVTLDVGNIEPTWTLTGDPGHFDQVVVNLLNNAFEACEENKQGSMVQLRVARNALGLTLSVLDDGPGVPDELEEAIFQPMITTRAHQQGTGLGLAICRDLMKATFGGSLVLGQHKDGARFDAFFPGGEEESSGRPKRQTQPTHEPFSALIPRH